MSPSRETIRHAFFLGFIALLFHFFLLIENEEFESFEAFIHFLATISTMICLSLNWSFWRHAK